MTASHRRQDISDEVWELLQPHLPGGPGKKDRPARDNRLFLNAVFWNLRTGRPSIKYGTGSGEIGRQTWGAGKIPIDYSLRLLSLAGAGSMERPSRYRH